MGNDIVSMNARDHAGKWRDPETISPDFDTQVIESRPWIYGRKMMKGKVSALFGTGGAGKSLFALVYMISIAIGRDLLGQHGGELKQRNVLIINNEDETSELMRRIRAILQHYGISGAELSGRFFHKSGYHEQLRLAAKGERGVERTEAARNIEVFCRANNIECISIDPLVSIHNCNENDNGEMDAVIGVIKAMASSLQASVQLLHHLRKPGDRALTDDDGRGASSVKNAARAVSLISRMTEKQANEVDGVDERMRYVGMSSGKENYNLSLQECDWFYLETVLIRTMGEDGEMENTAVGVPRPVDLDAKVKPTNERMTATKWGEALIPTFEGHKSPRLLTDALPTIEHITGLKKTAIQDHTRLLATDRDKPTYIKTASRAFHIWTEKHGNGPTAPRHLHWIEL